ncbi:LysR family transcriptional regulator [Reyranella sp.]|uniref:LysR family transcriptional regulator n=1 Tax=Reyranella sp. TaxID=1929291 RepID=UPI003D0E9A4B
MNLTIRQLRAFTLGAQFASFSEAAARMGITQPGYSLLIRQLEEEVGMALFRRTTRRVELTEAGREILQSAQRTLQQLEETCRRAEDFREARQGTLNLAFVPSVGCSLLPPTLSRFAEAYPGIKLVFHEAQAVGFAERVRSGQAEIGLGLLLQPDEQLGFEALTRDCLVALLHTQHPLAARPTVTWKALARFNSILVTNQSSVRVHADRAAASVGVDIEPTYVLDSLTTAVGLVRAGLGYAVLPSLALRSMDLGGAVVRVVEQPRAWRDIGLLTRSQFTLSPAAEAFAAVARAVAAEFPDPATLAATHRSARRAVR